MEQWRKKSRGFFTFIKAKGRLWLLLGGALFGVVLLLLGGMGDRGEAQVVSTEASGEHVGEIAAYEAKLEKELEAICEAVAGVGECEVMVTLAGGYTVQYASDGEGNPATVGTGSSEEAIFHTMLPPAVAGVGIVCRGGNAPAVRQTLTDLVSTTLGIPSNRVYITGK